MEKNKIAIICPYFGKLPLNVKYTLESMKRNTFIDWIIFTDDNISNYSFTNIKFIKYSFKEIEKLIYNKVGTVIKNVYKLCDYKIVYGKIFEDYLKGYEFWGYCDLDMVFGDLDAYLNKNNLLSQYDKIFDLGHFSIIRNDEYLNKLYMHYNNYKKILNSEYIYVLDESYPNHLSINEIMENENFNLYRNRECFSDIKIRYRNFYTLENEKSKYTYFYFNKGKLYKKSLTEDFQKEILYVHFQKRNFEEYQIEENFDSFYITPKGFSIEENIKSKFYSGYSLRIKPYIKMRIKRFIDNIKKRNDK